MSSPDRPTREQVDAALARAERRYALDERTLAAEVRALRAELEAHHASLVEALELGERGGGGEWTWDEFRAYIAKAKGGLAMTNETVRRRTVQLAEAAGHPAPHEATWPEALRAALVARTPQPAEPTARGICGDRLSPPTGSLPSYCDLPAGHKGWHQVQGGPRWSFDLERPFTAVSVPPSSAPAPLPAVPDGEDALESDVADPDDVRQALRAALRGRDQYADEVEQLRDQLDRAHALSRKQHRELVDLTMVPPLPFGDDVPARLDAAADALFTVCDDGALIFSVRDLADRLRDEDGGTPAIRAAVAAALARPTEREK